MKRFILGILLGLLLGGLFWQPKYIQLLETIKLIAR